MDTRKKEIAKYWLKIIILTLPSLGAISWSIKPALDTISATIFLEIPKQNKQEWNTEVAAEKIRQIVQMHFLDYKVYIPMEDIFVNNEIDDTSQTRIALLMNKSCGRASLFIWLPIRFRLPLIGDRLVEYCWKPTVTFKNPNEKN